MPKIIPCLPQPFAGPAVLKTVVNQLRTNESDVVQALQEMIRSIVKEENEEKFSSNDDNHMDHYTFLSFWQICMRFVNHAEEYMKRKGISKRRCYVGEEFMMPQIAYFVVTHPKKNVTSALHILMDGKWTLLSLDKGVFRVIRFEMKDATSNETCCRKNTTARWAGDGRWESEKCVCFMGHVRFHMRVGIYWRKALEVQTN